MQQARLEAGLSQAELAERLHLSQSAVSEIESGKTTIYLRRLFDLMHELDIELSASWEQRADESTGPR
ncbi:HTH-type transcriptional regulator/antitoxin HipB [Pseudoclavibacter sp. JAI123]|nr:HTH-type transcriptional regulator/antitoxin HipB [Pseudoclavibacter sp. JAI123]